MRLDALHLARGLDRLVNRIEAVGEMARPALTSPSPADADFRSARRASGLLRAQVEARRTAKSNWRLRAQVYFNLLAQVGEALALLKDVATCTR